MVETWKERIGQWLFKAKWKGMTDTIHEYSMRHNMLDQEVNQRVAALVNKMDPFELVMREYHGVFGEDFERPEERLDAASVLRLQSLGFTLADDPSFNYLVQWIMNSQGNETLIKAAVTPERILYGRAQISCVLALRKEVRRLSEAYKDVMAGRSSESFDATISTE